MNSNIIASHLLILLFIPICGSGQISIGTEDLPKTDVTFLINRADQVPTSIDLQTQNDVFEIDLSALITEGVDTMRFMDPDSRSEGKEFPDADLAAVYLGKDGFNVNYLRENDNQMMISGVYDDIFGNGEYNAFHLDPEGVYMNIPMQWKDSSSDIHKLHHVFLNPEFFPGADTLKLSATIVTERQVDGYGTVTLPGLAPIHVLRVKLRKEQFDTARLHSIAGNQWTRTTNKSLYYGYSFYAKGQGHPLVDVITSASGAVRSISYIANPLPASSSQNLTQSAVKVFPNPVHSTLFLEGAIEGQEIRVYNAVGQLAMTTLYKSGLGINLQPLPEGIYWLTFGHDQSFCKVPFIKM